MAASEMSRSSVASAIPKHWWQSNLKRRRIVAFYLFLFPWLFGFIVFTAGPMLASAGLVFTHYDILSPPRWAGLANIERMFFDDPLFWVSPRHGGLHVDSCSVEYDRGLLLGATPQPTGFRAVGLADGLLRALHSTGRGGELSLLLAVQQGFWRD